MYFALQGPVFEYPLKKVHWFGPEAIEAAYKFLFLKFVSIIINIRYFYGQFRSMIQLFYYVRLGGIALWFYR